MTQHLQNKEEMKRFLKHLDPEAETFTFQTFDDSPEHRQELAWHGTGTLDDLYPWLKSMNDDGAGVFVTINETDGRGRKKENIKRVRAVWQEDDGDGKQLPTEPHIIVESSPGKYHRYIFSSGGSDFDGHRSIMDTMVSEYGSDPNAKDISRVMRLPGFFHKKRPSYPHMVRIIHESGKDPMDWGDVKAVFKSSQQSVQEHRGSIVSYAEDERLDPVVAINAIAVKDNYHGSLLRLAGRYVAKGLQYTEVITILQTMMCSIPASARDDRWRDRYNDIPRTVKGAASKYAPKQIDRKFNLTPAKVLLETPSPAKWLIRNYLPPDGVAIMVAPPATIKTFLAIDWSCSIALGEDWSGLKTEQGGVAIIAGEGHFGIRRRLKAWGIDRDADLSDAPLSVSDTGASMTDADSFAAVETALDDFVSQYGELRMVVIDTLHRNLGAADENSAEDMAVFFRNLDVLRDKYHCLILVVHHSGHSAKDRGRGSSSIRAAVDVEYLIKSQSEDTYCLSCMKMKDAVRPAPTAFKLKSVELPWLDADGDAESSAVIVQVAMQSNNKHVRQLSGNKKRVLQALLSAMDSSAEKITLKSLPHSLSMSGDGLIDAVSLTVWRESSYRLLISDSDDPAKAQAAKQKAFKGAVNDLEDMDAVFVWNDYFWPNYMTEHQGTQALFQSYRGANNEQ